MWCPDRRVAGGLGVRLWVYGIGAVFLSGLARRVDGFFFRGSRWAWRAEKAGLSQRALSRQPPVLMGIPDMLWYGKSLSFGV